MSPNDRAFLIAKDIRLGWGYMPGEMDVLKNYLEETWDAYLVYGDVHLNEHKKSNPFALRLIIGTSEQIARLPTSLEDRQSRIGKYFARIVHALGKKKYERLNLPQLDIDYYNFDELSVLDCLGQIDLAQLKDSLRDRPISKIIRFYREIVFFYVTQQDLIADKAEGFHQIVEEQINELARAKDLFGSLKRSPKINVLFDTIDNLNAAGSIYNYIR